MYKFSLFCLLPRTLCNSSLGYINWSRCRLRMWKEYLHEVRNLVYCRCSLSTSANSCFKPSFLPFPSLPRRLTNIFGGESVGPLGGGFDGGGWETNSLVSDQTTVICLDDFHLNDREGRKVRACMLKSLPPSSTILTPPAPPPPPLFPGYEGESGGHKERSDDFSPSLDSLHSSYN